MLQETSQNIVSLNVICICICICICIWKSIPQMIIVEGKYPKKAPQDTFHKSFPQEVEVSFVNIPQGMSKVCRFVNFENILWGMKKALHDTFHRGFPREVKVKIVKLSFDYMDVLLAVVGSYTNTSNNVIFLRLVDFVNILRRGT